MKSNTQEIHFITKKSFVILFLCLSITTSGVFAQTYNDWSKWSITLEGGVNKFDGDIIQKYNDITPTSFNKITVGGSVECTVTPVWSMGLEYHYLPLSANATYSNSHHAEFVGKMHNLDYFMSFNVIKLFYRKTQSKWGIWGNIGAGYAWYKSTYTTTRAGMSIRDGHGNLYTDFNDTINDGRAAYVPIGLLIEYNFTKNFALGTKIQYRAYNKDYIEQRIQHGVTNDFIELATLQLRWKFNARHKNHTRNNNVLLFDNDTITDNFKGIQEKVDSLQKNLAIITPLVEKHENFINENAPEIEKIPDYNNRIKKLENIICPDGPDTDNDGVPDCRDKEPDTPENTPVDFWGRSITSYDVNSAAVFFDFDKTDLNEEAQRAIRYAANKLKSDPSLIVEVRGFTDNMGGEKYNEGLSQRRANKVKNELVKEYGINPDRIIANGKGKYDPDDKVIRYRPYRTVMFFYNK